MRTTWCAEGPDLPFFTLECQTRRVMCVHQLCFPFDEDTKTSSEGKPITKTSLVSMIPIGWRFFFRPIKDRVTWTVTTPTLGLRADIIEVAVNFDLAECYSCPQIRIKCRRKMSNADVLKKDFSLKSIRTLILFQNKLLYYLFSSIKV